MPFSDHSSQLQLVEIGHRGFQQATFLVNLVSIMLFADDAGDYKKSLERAFLNTVKEPRPRRSRPTFNS